MRWECDEHGGITPNLTGLVPACPVPVDGRPCGLLPLHDTGHGWAEPTPDTCRNNHTLGPGEVLVGRRSCLCPAARRARNGHRTWTCRECGDVLTGPACDEAPRPD